MNLDISFIIPTRRKPKNLKRCLDSISKCAPNVEIILVSGDDDNTIKNILNNYKNLNIKATRLRGRCGCVAAIWKGVILSNKKFVGFVSDDLEFFTENSDHIIYDKMLKNKNTIEMRYGIGLHPFTRRDFWLMGGGYPICYEHYYCDNEYGRLANEQFGVIGFEDKINVIHQKTKEPIYESNNTREIVVDANDKPLSLSPSIESLDATRYDKKLFDARVTWWLNNNKPHIIPSHIGLEKLQ